MKITSSVASAVVGTGLIALGVTAVIWHPGVTALAFVTLLASAADRSELSPKERGLAAANQILNGKKWSLFIQRQKGLG